MPLERAVRKYTMTLPLGTQVEITIQATLVPDANALYERWKADGGGYTPQDTLALCALTAVNGEEVRERNTGMLLDSIEFLTLKLVVENLVPPTQAQLDAAVATLRLVEKPPIVEPVPADGIPTPGFNPQPDKVTQYTAEDFKGAAPAQGENVPYQPNPYFRSAPNAAATS